MPTSMNKIQTITVPSGGAATVTFTSIPQTYTDLILKVSSRSTDASNFQVIRIWFNSAEGTLRELYGTNTTVGSAALSQNRVGYTSAASNTSNTFGNAEIYIPNYTSSTANKSSSADAVSENNGAISVLTLTGNLYASNSPVTSITLFPDGGSWVENSTFSLYGVLKYAETGTGSKATGGTVTTAGGYTYHTFFSSGMFTPTTSISGAEVLCVAGGGGAGGASWAAGGGGAGGLIYASNQSFTSGTGYTAIVGAGGTSGRGTQSGDNGSNSSFGSLTVALGGGGGGGYQGGGQTPYAARVGGSGGGGPSGQSYGGSEAGAAGTAGQGNAGGLGYFNPHMTGGGGGGAGAAGAAATTTKAGNGGNGVSTYSAWGSATGTGHNVSGTFWYAGGGGGSAGGSGFSSTGSIGGNGGGGYGAPSIDTFGSSGMPRTGGGGGPRQADVTVGSGGSGIVIVRYTT